MLCENHGLMNIIRSGWSKNYPNDVYRKYPFASPSRLLDDFFFVAFILLTTLMCVSEQHHMIRHKRRGRGRRRRLMSADSSCYQKDVIEKRKIFGVVEGITIHSNLLCPISQSEKIHFCVEIWNHYHLTIEAIEWWVDGSRKDCKIRVYISAPKVFIGNP